MNEQFHLDPEDDLLAQSLEAEELETSVSRLSATPEEEQMQRRLHFVDNLLRNAPLVKPSAEFAEKVIETIRRYTQKPFDRNIATGLILGLSSVSAIITFTLIGFICLVIAIILNWTTVYQTLVLAAGSLKDIAESIYEWMDSRVTASPFMTGISILSVPLFFVWVWWMRRLNPSERDA